MSGWPELVTSALLGTTRRPVPEHLPASWGGPGQPADGRPVADDAVRVLELAVRHRALVRAGRPLRSAPEPPASPPDPGPGPSPGPAATGLLTELLGRPDPTLIGYWLACCVEHGQAVHPVHWTPLARLAARSTAYDRWLLGRALGDQGRWFLRQNPDWHRLAADAEQAPNADGSAPPAIPEASADALVEDPELIFAQPDPWPVGLVAAALALLGRGTLGRATRSYATRLGVRLPASVYDKLPEAAGYYLMAPEAGPARRRAVRDAFVAVELAAWMRVRIATAFSDDDAPQPRVEIPRV